MKTNYNKSEIFSMAWGMFKSEVGSFSACLKAAWNEAKNTTKKVAEVVVRNVKEAFELINLFDFRAGIRSSEGDSIIKMVAENGNGVARKIAESFKYSENELTVKQAWCVAYEYMRVK